VAGRAAAEVTANIVTFRPLACSRSEGGRFDEVAEAALLATD